MRPTRFSAWTSRPYFHFNDEIQQEHMRDTLSQSTGYPDPGFSQGRIQAAASQKPVKVLPYGVYFWTVSLLALAGLLDSLYLSVSHYRVYNDVLYESFCAISRSVNCDTVSQHPTSVFLGMPVPVWGVWAYGFFGLLLVFARPAAVDKRRLWSILMLIAFGFSLYSLILAYISKFVINSYCIMCIVSYGINFMLLFYTWLVRRRFGSEPLLRALQADIRHVRRQSGRALGILASFAVAFFVVWAVFPVYWNFDPPVLTARLPTGVTEEGYPWIGAENPELVITEYTDYLCFQCNKMHFFLRKLMVRYPGKIRVVHRHFPMDHRINPIVKEPVHQGAGLLALIAIYAETQGKFWPASDYIFATARMTGKLDLKALGKRIGSDPQAVRRGIGLPEVRKKLEKDLIDGIKDGVKGTPTFVINGKAYQGHIPAKIIAAVIKSPS
jgi:uncharacterized membrane protein/protein-disulfide isomerase